MIDYIEYVGMLKNVKVPLDQDRLYGAIKRRATVRPATWVGPTAVSLAGAVAVLLVGLVLFVNFGAGDDETIASYLNEGETINGSPLISYVFGD
jgi:hypothetical protein